MLPREQKEEEGEKQVPFYLHVIAREQPSASVTFSFSLCYWLNKCYKRVKASANEANL